MMVDVFIWDKDINILSFPAASGATMSKVHGETGLRNVQNGTQFFVVSYRLRLQQSNIADYLLIFCTQNGNYFFSTRTILIGTVDICEIQVIIYFDVVSGYTI